MLGLGGSSSQIRVTNGKRGGRSVSGGQSLIHIGKGPAEDGKNDPGSSAGGAYWKNPYYEKILERFNKLDLDVRMKIVGSNVFKNRRVMGSKAQIKPAPLGPDVKLPRLRPTIPASGPQQGPMFFGEKPK